MDVDTTTKTIARTSTGAKITPDFRSKMQKEGKCWHCWRKWEVGHMCAEKKAAQKEWTRPKKADDYDARDKKIRALEKELADMRSNHSEDESTFEVVKEKERNRAKRKWKADTRAPTKSRRIFETIP